MAEAQGPLADLRRTHQVRGVAQVSKALRPSEEERSRAGVCADRAQACHDSSNPGKFSLDFSTSEIKIQAHAVRLKAGHALVGFNVVYETTGLANAPDIVKTGRSSTVPGRLINHSTL